MLLQYAIIIIIIIMYISTYNIYALMGFVLTLSDDFVCVKHTT